MSRVFTNSRSALLVLAVLTCAACLASGQAAPTGSSRAPLTDYQGVYAYHRATTLTIVAADTMLFAVLDDARYPLRPLGNDRFVNASGDTIPFRRGRDGRVSGFVERGTYFARRTSSVDAFTVAAVRASPRPLGPYGRPMPYAYTTPPDLHDGIAVGDIAGSGLDTADVARLVAHVVDGTYSDVHAILVYRGGRLLVEEYFYGYDRNRPHQLRSASKSVVSLLVGIAIDRGLIPGERARVLQRLPEARPARPDPREDGLTLQDLLTMRSGLACDDWDASSPGNESRVYESDDWVKYVLALPMAEPPGSRGRYCSGNVMLAGRIVERASGLSLPAFARKYLFLPLGIRARDVRWNYTLRASNASTFAQLYLRPRDMLKLGMLLQQQGKWSGRQILSRKWVARSTAEWSTVGDQRYGYFWWHQSVDAATRDGPRRIPMIVATGNGGQKIYVVPSLDLIVVMTGGNYNAQSPGTAIMAHELIPAMLRASRLTDR